MIYCVVPEELAEELLDKLTSYYADDPDVKVIVDRRKSERRARGSSSDDGDHVRTIRDRRRPRVPGEFPPVDASSAGA
jgi:hypothetical protein